MMADEEPFVVEVEMSEAVFDMAEPAMCASLLHQNRAFRDRLQPGAWRVRLRQVGLGVSALGLGLSLLLLVVGVIQQRPPGSALVFVSIFSAAFMLFINGKRIEAFLNGLAPKSIARRVRAVVRPLRQKAPYTVTYAFDSLGYQAAADAIATSKRVAFDDVNFVIATEAFFHLYKDAKALSPKAIIYFTGDKQRDEIESRLLAANMIITKITERVI